MLLAAIEEATAEYDAAGAHNPHNPFLHRLCSTPVRPLSSRASPALLALLRYDARVDETALRTTSADVRLRAPVANNDHVTALCAAAPFERGSGTRPSS